MLLCLLPSLLLASACIHSAVAAVATLHRQQNLSLLVWTKDQRLSEHLPGVQQQIGMLKYSMALWSKQLWGSQPF